MLRKYSNSRTLGDNLRLGTLTAFTAGMVNIGSLVAFFAFSSNVTGHYAILASEVVEGDLYGIGVVFGWIFLFFFGSFTSNMSVIHFSHFNKYLAHAMPLILEIACLAAVGVYGEYFYQETLTETEALLAVMLYAMGVQNGLTASISNSTVKTTHLTGTTTDLGILFSMFTKKRFRSNPELRVKATLLLSIAVAYLSGAIVAGLVFVEIGFSMFYLACSCLLVVLVYDFYKINKVQYLLRVRYRRLYRNNPRLALVRQVKQAKDKVPAMANR